MKNGYLSVNVTVVSQFVLIFLKKSENVNEDTIGNEIVTSDQLVNAIQGTFFYTEPGCTNCFIYFVKRAIGD
jgi:hypothetical protein